MLPLPSAAEAVLFSFSGAFTQPTFRRFLLLTIGAILCPRRKTTTQVLRTLAPLVEGHHTAYHRVFSRAAWSLWTLAAALVRRILSWLPPEGTLHLVADDTSAQHKGKNVYGKGCHHDAVRSTHTHTVWRWGHRWVTLSILVRFPFASRPWALPVLVALYRPE